MSQQKRLIIVSGLSGAGKTIALHVLEDLGYYCIDNLPASVTPERSTSERTSSVTATRVGCCWPWVSTRVTGSRTSRRCRI